MLACFIWHHPNVGVDSADKSGSGLELLSSFGTDRAAGRGTQRPSLFNRIQWARVSPFAHRAQKGVRTNFQIFRKAVFSWDMGKQKCNALGLHCIKIFNSVKAQFSAAAERCCSVGICGVVRQECFCSLQRNDFAFSFQDLLWFQNLGTIFWSRHKTC